ncbi:hypothetical protein LOC68_19850 [Blastopirellula sp. JC732]|uniref:Uncharacterized protein n=1 Tax=Blastopirellula sediminis TaxID=2894196 RepID=A0A9X1SGZ1_9BACT|nr:hypothetical protein [Blastopirellula sediminis]MCC9606046.1 hypothetical protein [Blastopirellula sediminis]MCC9630655.1 hypothetical protein [Blastopirellula sediminis]
MVASEEENDFPEEAAPTEERQPRDLFVPFRFSLTRLAVAIVAATLPLLFISDWNREYGWIFCISSVAIAGVVIRVHAADLPRLNVAFQLIVPCIALFACGMCCVPFIFPAIAGIGASFYFAYLMFPREAGDEHEPTSTIFLWLSGIFPFFLLCMAALFMSFGRRMSTPIPSDSYLPIVLMPTIFALLTAINLYWFATDPDEPLDDNPTRAYLYELTLVLAPCATLFWYWGKV